jgi:hypothetical protein
MPAGKVVVRGWARFLPAWVWCVGLDAADIATNVADFVLGFIGIGIIVDLGGDVLQGMVAYAIFETPEMWKKGFGIDALLLPGLDILPSYTAAYLYETRLKDHKKKLMIIAGILSVLVIFALLLTLLLIFLLLRIKFI